VASSWFEKIQRMSTDSQLSGKRFRARLAIAVSGMLDLPKPTAVHLGTFVELVQAASLVHDDVVDDASFRRGKQTINSAHGNRFAVLTGDYIISQALIELGLLNSQELVSVFANVISQMTLGEAMEIETTFASDRSVEHYLGTISLKTASLMSFCTVSPCIIAGSDAATRNAMRNYGLELGMAFQIADDLLDMVGPDGKKAGKDYEQGIMTYPMILLDRDQNFWEQDYAKVLGDAAGKGALSQTRSLAGDYIKNAKASLNKANFTGKPEAKDLLCTIADSVQEKLPEGDFR
jgi:octaprenyl-diphosphate synthase